MLYTFRITQDHFREETRRINIVHTSVATAQNLIKKFWYHLNIILYSTQQILKLEQIAQLMIIALNKTVNEVLSV